MKKANISDVAELAGVSKSTISNYLNNKKGRLSPETSKRIQNAIDVLDYCPYLGAQRLVNKEKSKIIGIIIENMDLANTNDTQFYFKTLLYMHDILQENDYKFVIIPDEAMTVNEFISFVKSFGTTFFDGYLVYNVQKNDELIDYFKQNNINFVVLGITDDPQVHHICTRHEKGIFDGMVELKREKVNSYILLLNRSNSQVVASQRESGFNFACEILSLPKEVAHVFYYSNNAEAMDILQKILEESLDFKGIICSGGLLNIVSFLCEKEHKMIGIDISLILYDYWSFNENNSYYTIIQQPVKELSIAAIQTLLNLINDNKYHVIQTEFNPKLIFGVSSKNREE